jgi:ribulose-phosphate 3-epimerase
METRRIRIAPSLLTADLARLGDEVATMEASGVDRIHWDVMDGCFVPNLTFGPDVVAATRPHSSLPFDAHLMVADPDRLLGRWVAAGCGLVTVHAEACTHLHRTLGAIRELGAQAGLALNPATPPSAIEHVADLVDLVLVMTVNPGFGGQRYLASMEPKIAAVRAIVDRTGRDVEVEVDGGISADTIDAAWRAGADSFVSGSALYRHPGGPAAAVAELRARCDADRLVGARG